MTVLYWSTELQSSCKHPHRCNRMHFLTAAFTLLSVFVVYFFIERKARSIYLHIHLNTAQQLQVRSAGFEALRCLLLNCIQESWITLLHYSATLVKPQNCRLLHEVIWDQTTTRQQIFVDFFFFFFIMSTNRCSPNNRVVVYTHCEHTFQFKQLAKVHAAFDDPF